MRSTIKQVSGALNVHVMKLISIIESSDIILALYQIVVKNPIRFIKVPPDHYIAYQSILSKWAFLCGVFFPWQRNVANWQNYWR